MVWCALGRIMVSLSVVDVEGGSAAGRLADLTHGHGEAVAVGLGDLQTRAQGVAANVEAEGEGRQGEDEALHWSFAVDALSIEAGGVGVPPLLCHLSDCHRFVAHGHIKRLNIVPVNLRPTIHQGILPRYKLLLECVGNFILKVCVAIIHNRARIHPAIVSMLPLVNYNGSGSCLQR